LSVTINASTSAGLIITPDTSGNIQLQYNGVAAPAFGVYLGTNQSVSPSTWTKVQCNTKEFDTANAYDNVTNYRFQPTIAGYYQISGSISWDSTVSVSRGLIGVYKNGSLYKILSDISAAISRTGGSVLIYLNGSTDYLELWGYMTGSGSLLIDSASYNTWFTGCLLRSA